ncbi:MAG: M1 family metallopeptidase [Flavisolibacter sp.]
MLSAQKLLPMEKGVSQRLAIQRKALLSHIRYTLYFSITATPADPIEASEQIDFDLKNNRIPLQLDFKEEPTKLHDLNVNGKNIIIHFKNEHLLIDPQYLQAGKNTVSIHFEAGQTSLNRHTDYLYTLLVPDRARTLFPCFDQPDLKAKFLFSLSLPSEWKAFANGPLKDSSLSGNVKTVHFQESDLFSTYLFSFVVGRFEGTEQIRGTRKFHFYYRETDSNRIRRSVDTIFGWHQRAIDFLQRYTGINFPFQKLDFAAIPDFQYGGMEHVGAIDYRASTLFLDAGATREQEIARANLIAHETSHMWFGDLVTMQWFNDVWMKEVFANFMADKITKGSNNDNLKFLLTHYPRAYAVDRTAGANPIRQPLGNLQDAGSLYGAIIYDKAPVMMRQLELLMGENAFRDGLRDYLSQHRFANASWPDLINVLDAHTPANLQLWNKVWVNTPGRPAIAYVLEENKGRIKKFSLKQKGQQSANYLLPQFFRISLVYPESVEEYDVNFQSAEKNLAVVQGKKLPEFFLFNSSGQGYGLFPVDPRMKPASVILLKDPVMRASAYINLYENMLEGKAFNPLQLITGLSDILSRETEELNLGLITGQITDIFWHFISVKERNGLVSRIEDSLWTTMQKASTAGKKKLLYRAYQNLALTRSALDRLHLVWKYQEPPAGLHLSEEEFTSLALILAVKNYPDTIMLREELSRIKNEDRRQRLVFLMPAVSADEAVRDSFFASLRDVAIRKKEACVGDALVFLHHPLRTANSIKYLQESLDMLQEVQLTGDIFFPGVWLNASLGSYQSKEAADIVRLFLKEHPNYNPKLRAKILQAADPLFRAEKLVGGE